MIKSSIRRAAFLDRDGVINRDTGYVYRWRDFEIIPRALDALARLKDLNYTIVIVTNQSGIGRGYYTEEMFHALMKQFIGICSQKGINLHYYHCPHMPPVDDAGCDCRKPHPGMLLRAARELDIDLDSSFLVGDRLSDICAGKEAGLPRRYLVGDSLSDFTDTADLITARFDTLWDCVAVLPFEEADMPKENN